MPVDSDSSRKTALRYRIRRCPDDIRAEEWLNEVAGEGYRFVSVAPVSTTNHFTKEIESEVWVIVERAASPAARSRADAAGAEAT